MFSFAASLIWIATSMPVTMTLTYDTYNECVLGREEVIEIHQGDTMTDRWEYIKATVCKGTV